MNVQSAWTSVANFLRPAAPILSALLDTTGPVGMAAGALLTTSLGVANTPSAAETALQSAGATPGMIQAAQIAKIQAAESQAIAWTQAMQQNASDVNQTMRAELVSTNLFKSGWRPLWGWCLAPTFALSIIAMPIFIAWAVFQPGGAAALGPMLIWAQQVYLPMWQGGLLVLGVGVWMRTRDKQLAAGKPTLYDAVSKAFPLGKQ